MVKAKFIEFGISIYSHFLLMVKILLLAVYLVVASNRPLIVQMVQQREHQPNAWDSLTNACT